MLLDMAATTAVALGVEAQWCHDRWASSLQRWSEAQYGVGWSGNSTLARSRASYIHCTYAIVATLSRRNARPGQFLQYAMSPARLRT